MKYVLSLLLIASMALSAFCFADDNAPTSLKLGDTFPLVNLNSLSGTVLPSTKLKYPLILSVFTTWCHVCKEEIPKLNSLYTEAKSKKTALNIVGLDAGESINKVKNFKDKQQLGFDVYADSDMSITKLLHINGVPVILVFNKKGQLAYQGYTIPDNWQTLIK